MAQPLLQVKNLATHFHTEEGVVKSVQDVTFEVNAGEVLGVVGESGCGKSVTSMSILRLVQQPQGKIVNGEILFNGTDLLKLSEAEMRKIRGNKVSLISQDPMTSLNPVLTIGEQIMEAIILHQKLNRKDAKAKAIEMLKAVGIPSPEQRVDQYPHEFSGGMRQRAIIAMALSCEPELLIADEPTTALDVTIQAQILDLMREIKDKRNAAIVLITHDLGVVAEMCDKVAVMYAGKVVEYTDVVTLFKNPQHPYTIGLLNSIPKIEEQRDRLEPIDGQPPNLVNLPKGCSFGPRCKEFQSICGTKDPTLLDLGKNGKTHQVRCLLREGN
ncbi:MAG: ABC transporter ATP-binding protein [Candidatus Sericytochromatia bacterium]